MDSLGFCLWQGVIDVLDVGADRIDGNVELVGNLALGQGGSQESQYLQLARAERFHE